MRNFFKTVVALAAVVLVSLTLSHVLNLASKTRSLPVDQDRGRGVARLRGFVDRLPVDRGCEPSAGLDGRDGCAQAHESCCRGPGSSPLRTRGSGQGGRDHRCRQRQRDCGGRPVWFDPGLGHRADYRPSWPLPRRPTSSASSRAPSPRISRAASPHTRCGTSRTRSISGLRARRARSPHGSPICSRPRIPRIKAADPAATVIAGGLAPTRNFFALTMSPVTFVERMYAAGAKGFFDALAYHPYLYAPANVRFSKSGALRAVRRHPAADDRQRRRRQADLGNRVRRRDDECGRSHAGRPPQGLHRHVADAATVRGRRSSTPPATATPAATIPKTTTACTAPTGRPSPPRT